MTGEGPARLYETLARWQWWQRRLRRARPGEGLELRKRLSPPAGDGPADGAAGLDAWLQQLAGVASRRRILDVGCGFGASLQRWVRAADGVGLGLTASAFQVARATAAAAQVGLGERCRFVARSFDETLGDLPGAPFDLVLAIEALGHARDLAATLRALAGVLAPGGRLLWVEDRLRDEGHDDADVAELATRWCSPPLASVAAARRALAAAGLHATREIDLTDQVPFSPMASNDARRRKLERLRRWTPSAGARRLADAFLGGLALERLYARGLACYRVWMCEPSPEVP